MSVCTGCRLAFRRAIRQRLQLTQHIRHIRLMSSKSSSAAENILSKPTWSINSLLSAETPTEQITPKQLHHLLRLSALPLPKTTSEEDTMIATLQNQLRFVQAVQRVNTKGVEPLQAIRDETDTGRTESTVALKDLKDLLDKEITVGHYKRPRRVKEKTTSEAEAWDALSTASKRAGKYFVVDSGKKPQDG